MGAVAVAGLGVVPSAGAEPGGHFSWGHRDDGRGVPDQTVTSTDADLWITSFNNQVTLIDQGVDGRGIEFLPPAGQTLQAGVTYQVGGTYREPTATAGQVLTHRDGKFCGREAEELEVSSRQDLIPAAGWFRVEQIEYAGSQVVAFAATYEISCQYVDGPLGFEGSIAYDAAEVAAPIPAKPATPAPVAGLEVENTDPNIAGTSTTTLTWTNPSGYRDITIDMVQLCCDSAVPALLNGRYTRQWRGRATSYLDNNVEFMDGRLYRVVPRGSTGRVGTPVQVRVFGSRLHLEAERSTIQIGETTTFSGRLTRSSPKADPHDSMSGPPIAGRRLFLCQRDVGAASKVCNAVASTLTDDDGRFALRASPVANSWYSVMMPSSSSMVGNRSIVLLSTGVAPQTDIAVRSVRGRATVTTAQRGSMLTFTTSRDRRGSTGVVKLQRRIGDTWRTVVTQRLGTGRSRLVIRYRESRRGDVSYRIVKMGDSRHVNGYSKVRRFRVR
ncbi:hypothetical protein ASE01_15415 [Nocardioides sp. Root190]|nr:hypothetical protein ASE01_15415 [Nocardioides sp. Root190]